MNVHIPFTELPDLASSHFGGKALSCSDDFFASMNNLLKPEQAVFIPGKYDDNGKWMDGWESRRKRNLTAENNHDWVLIRLGIPGHVHGICVDTSFFTGNFPEACEIALTQNISDQTAEDILQKSKWTVVSKKAALQGGSLNYLPIHHELRVTHLKMKIFPDGGVARLRVHGEPVPDQNLFSKGPADTACIASGGRVISASDFYFGHKDQLLYPGKPQNMGEGWETKRRRGTGSDFIIVKLGALTRISRIEVDTEHFKGNYPDSLTIQGLPQDGSYDAYDFRDNPKLVFETIIPETKLKPSATHEFSEQAIKVNGKSFRYIKLIITPDGGISRLRVFGTNADKRS